MRGKREEPHRLTADAFVATYGHALGEERLVEILSSKSGFRCSRARVKQLLARLYEPRFQPVWSGRFWRRVIKGEPHWGWDGATDRHGVGMLNIIIAGRRRPVAATRLSWLVHFGEIPPDRLVARCHDAPACCHPAHIALATRSEVARVNGNALRADLHPFAVLTSERVREIRSARADGVPYRDLAESYGVAAATVRDAVVGRSWASVA